MPVLPLPFSISQNPAKDQALAALPPVAALLKSGLSVYVFQAGKQNCIRFY
jgi:hypothetical protein